MKIKGLFLVATLLLVSLSFANAQTKGETKLYNTTIAKGDLKSLNKFLAKYPTSVYAPEITKLKDSITFFNLNSNDVVAYMEFCKQHPESYYLYAANKKIQELNTSSISDAEAREIAARFYGKSIPTEYITKSVKNFNKENVVVIAPLKGISSYRIEVITQNGSNWEISNTLTENKYILDDNLNILEFVGECKVVTINGEQYIEYAYTNRSDKVDQRTRLANNNAEYILNLYSIDHNSVFSAMYSGVTDINVTALPFDNEEFIIYGKCNDTAGGGMYATDQMKHLLRDISGNKKLQPFDKQRFLTQETIQWWYDNNPEKAKTLKFGTIDKDNPIAIAFEQSTQKEKVGNKIVNYFDIFNTTVIVSYDRGEKTYALIWCEPVPVKKSDAELSNLYGEKNSIIALLYYKGNTAYKKRINLNSRIIY
jgi:hypothetical protein